MANQKSTETTLSQLTGMPISQIEQEVVSIAAMQKAIMPDPERLEVFCDYDIYGKTLPVAVVGGDFYDFIDLEGKFDLRDKMGIVIADAAGHGLVSAMLIRDFNTALYTAISLQAHYEKDTTPLLFTKINRRMYRSSRPNQFISAFYGELASTGRLRYINAGHFSPILAKEDRLVELEVGGPVLGAFRNTPSEFQVGEEYMEPGDILVCYTDGVIEVCGHQGEEYGVEKLRRIIRENRRLTSRELFELITREVEQFSRNCGGQTDDLTLAIIKKVSRG